ncbi:unnamed protein product [Zymoseptoria tritici ST99CH_3D1]|uniref:54S ribosomal protein L31, mitochondrial n=2 Tax=Zymoseptoria tritici TaxID=1047171 RepID=F9X675_ZYMTI|nr:uncharacterized protein MYCGRDRAFT_103653 [Zymoseptoria tritici IPO323]EGP89487.1 hypothetical protein MYCGRDRAFT_103653 [Zymoseptoria tritici IPO323]SMR48430.1 unnamed protein product [Zymoseptoria tritici ST99CH_1E4]SMR49643.1 unnamed protein product [Zymoseptoria tritici ST99CH_3D1]
MFGAFKASAPLSGGLLWKIPWRLSAPQKLRHRRRMRRVDNVVAVLDTALKRSKTALDLSHQQTSSEQAGASEQQLSSALKATHGTATTSDLETTAEGQRLLAAHDPTAILLGQRRHGKGPKQGEYLPTGKLLANEAKEQGTLRLISRWRAEMPTEQEMLPKDKYSIFDKKVRGYRKGIHKLPKWTRVSQRLNPPGF